MQAVQQVHDIHFFFPTSLSDLSSYSTLMSQLSFSWLSWVSLLEDVSGGSVQDPQPRGLTGS